MAAAERMPMMDMTTNSSMREKAGDFFKKT
jgi:hypothetical protein